MSQTFLVLKTLLPPPKNYNNTERKLKMREAQADVKREIEAYRAMREAKLRAPQPEAAALDARISRVTAEVDRAISGLEAEYASNRETVMKVLLQVRCYLSPTLMHFSRLNKIFFLTALTHRWLPRWTTLFKRNNAADFFSSYYLPLCFLFYGKKIEVFSAPKLNVEFLFWGKKRVLVAPFTASRRK